MKNLVYIIGIYCLLVCILPMQLFAHVELNYPEGGETFYSGDSILIQWTEVQAHDTENWELFYSPDAGETWEAISNSISYPTRSFYWTVPVKETTKGRIKIFMNNIQDQDYEDISANFSVKNLTDISYNHPADGLFETFVIAPNPIQSTCYFGFKLDKQEQLTIEIFTMEGKFVYEIFKQYIKPGDYHLPWNCYGLKPGQYFCVVSNGHLKKSFNFQIVW